MAASDRGEEREAALAVLGDMPRPLRFDLAFPIAVLVEELTATSLETGTDLASVLRSAAQTGSISNARYAQTKTLALKIAQRLTDFPGARALYEQIAADAATAIRGSAQRDLEAEMLWWH